MPNKVNRILKIDHCMAIVFKGSPCRKKVSYKRNTGVFGGLINGMYQFNCEYEPLLGHLVFIIYLSQYHLRILSKYISTKRPFA